MTNEMLARRTDAFGQVAVTLGNRELVCTVEALGAMVPLLGLRRGAGAINAHWVPDWRGADPAPWADARHAGIFGAKVLYLLAGEFPCAPTFGAGCTVDGAELPVHGDTATLPWTFEAVGVDAASGAAFARSTLRSPGLPLRWEKLDLVLPGQPVHWSFLRVHDDGEATTVNLVRHNTLGPPFLAPGCRIGLSAKRFLAIPPGTEYDRTRRLAPEVEFDDLRRAPLQGGGTVDLTEVPGPIGRCDFVTGAVPRDAPLGWSCVVNPQLRLAYLCLFPGLAGLPPGEVAPAQNDLWMEYGGRDYPPWAAWDGGPDRTYCLGTENGTSRFGDGLAASRARPELLGRETTVAVPARGHVTSAYGTALVSLRTGALLGGVTRVEPDGDGLVLSGPGGEERVGVSGDLAAPRRAAAGLWR